MSKHRARGTTKAPKVEEQQTRIKVRATRAGEYQSAYRSTGDEFYIYDEKHFSDVWMEKVENQPEGD